jgi:hypothetical protein
MNNDNNTPKGEKTFEDFQQEVEKEKMQELVDKGAKMFFPMEGAITTEAAQRYGDYREQLGRQESQWKTVEFANWLPTAKTSNYKIHPQYFNVTGEGSAKRVWAKPTGELYEYWLKNIWQPLPASPPNTEKA